MPTDASRATDGIAPKTGTCGHPALFTWHYAGYTRESRCLYCELEKRLAPEPAGNDAEDAAKWRALMSCERIRMMGCAGLHPDSTGYPPDYIHIGMEFWTRHSGAGDASDVEGREWFAKFIERSRRLSPTKEGGL